MPMIAGGCFFIVGGVIFIIFRERLAEVNVNWNLFFGIHIDKEYSKRSYYLGGIVCVIFGIWIVASGIYEWLTPLH